MTHSNDDRSPLARAFEQATHVTTIGIMMVAPVLPGYWLDKYLGTLPLFTILGLAFGMSASLWQLIKFVNRQESNHKDIDGRGD
ncbi:MAG TPA: AtpZ/AtpI family protein [Pirellulaceae bacterium]|nr:AtpZ/AtpI family protein [Pirellulaceae bacterium]HMO91290.1 AtpZ/AtpI family protein [Pirellulaceae bacterium]HMP68526.1 AtpZ/AtpI family protein [Pirellulaceae bacterium]